MVRSYTSPWILLLVSLAAFHATGQDRCPAISPPLTNLTPMDTIGDFTIITTDRDTLNLYSTLDEGKTVFLDLFYTRCGFCQLYAPIIEEIYQNTGAGQEDILFWGISNDPYDTDAIIDAYKLEFGVTNPCAGPQGGGIQALTTIIEGQNFQGYPTYCVVCPDHTMFFDPCYPPNVSCFDPFFEYCGSLVDVAEPGTITAGRVAVFPNPTRGTAVLRTYFGQETRATAETRDTYGRVVMKSLIHGSIGSNEVKMDFSAIPEGLYFLRLIPDIGPSQLLKVMVIK